MAYRCRDCEHEFVHATDREIREGRIRCPRCLRWADPIRGRPKKDEMQLTVELLKNDFADDDPYD